MTESVVDLGWAHGMIDRLGTFVTYYVCFLFFSPPIILRNGHGHRNIFLSV